MLGEQPAHPHDNEHARSLSLPIPHSLESVGQVLALDHREEYQVQGRK